MGRKGDEKSTWRHTPYYTHPDIRIYELNKRLQHRTEESDNIWWDTFVTEFFEDDATLALTFCFEEGPRRYTIGRTLIPRYFRSIFEAGVTELYYHVVQLKESSIGRTLIPRYFRSIFEAGVTELYYHVVQPKESYQSSTITLDCENTTMVTHHIKPVFTQVLTEGRLILEFTFDDLMRIRNWHFAIHQHREMIPKSTLINVQDPATLEQLSKNITRQGMTSVTLNYLRLCYILEPMQELMSRHKTYNMNPRDCLKSTLFQRWQRMYAPHQDFNPEMMWQANTAGPGFDDGDPGVPYGRKVSDSKTKTPRAPRTKRKRKSSATPTATTPTSATNSKSTNKKSPSSTMSLATQDVMVVGEPSLMGGEFGDEDERLITRLGCDQLTSSSPLHLPLPRLENAQYDASNGVGDDEEFGQSPMTSTSPSLTSWSSESRKQAQEDNTGD